MVLTRSASTMASYHRISGRSPFVLIHRRALEFVQKRGDDIFFFSPLRGRQKAWQGRPSESCTAQLPKWVVLMTGKRGRRTRPPFIPEKAYHPLLLPEYRMSSNTPRRALVSWECESPGHKTCSSIRDTQNRTGPVIRSGRQDVVSRE